MPEITITGASDDLIEIEGHIEAEWNWVAFLGDDEERRYIAISDGTILSVHYDQDGIWRFERIAIGTAEYTKISGDVELDTFDVVKLVGTAEQLKWVVFGTDIQKAQAA